MASTGDKTQRASSLAYYTLCATATERHTPISLSRQFRMQHQLDVRSQRLLGMHSGARSRLPVGLTVAWSGCWGLLPSTGHYAGPGATGVATFYLPPVSHPPPFSAEDQRRRTWPCDLGDSRCCHPHPPRQDTPRHPHDHKDHHHWQWFPRSW